MSIGHNTIKVTQTLDDKQFMQEMLKQQREIAKLLSKMEQLGQASAKSGAHMKSSFSGALKNLTQFAGALTGIGSAIGSVLAVVNQVRREYDNLKNRQQQAGQTHVNYQDTLSQALSTMGGMFSAKQIDQIASDMVTRNNHQFDRNKAVKVMEEAYSSRGVTSREDALEAILAAENTLKISPHLSAEDAGSIGALSTSLAGRYGISSRESIGYLLNVKEKSNIVDTKNLIDNLSPSIMNMANYSAALNESGALAAALTQGIGDITGEVTATTLVNFGDSLRKRFRDQNGDLDFMGAIRQLQADPEMRRQFFEGGTFNGQKFGAANLGKGKSRPSLEQILTPGTHLNRQFESFLWTIGGAERGGQTYDRYYRQIQESTSIAQTQRAFDNQATTTQLENPDEALSGISREGLRKNLQAAGISDFEQRTTELWNDLSSGGEVTPQTASRYLRKRAGDYGRDRIQSYPGFGDHSFEVAVPASESNQKIANTLNRIADSLDRIHTTQTTPPPGPRIPARSSVRSLGEQ